MTTPAAVLVCDCPWQPRDALPGERGAAHKYKTMSTDELCEVQLPPRLARHVLFFWRLASMVSDALRVLDAWGYEPVSELVWRKLRPCSTCCAVGYVEVWRIGDERVLVPARAAIPTGMAVHACPTCRGERGTPYLGLGRYTRGAHEVCTIARPRRGRAPDRLDLGVPSTFAAPMLCDVDGLVGARGRLVHSAKPDAFYEIVRNLYAGPRVEMFSRRERPGFASTASDQSDALAEVARVMRDVWPAREREERLAAARRRAQR